MNITPVNYRGFIYGFYVPPHRIIRTRRNGVEQWTGNSARSTGGYSMDDAPSKSGGFDGAKRIGNFDIEALLSHGALDVLRDVQLVRSGRNENYWNALRAGRPLPPPDVPFVYKKFLATLKAGGINVVDKGDTLKIVPLTDKAIEGISRGAISTAETVDAKLRPIPGGLFDPKLTGGFSSSNWTHVDLPEPMPNPVMEEPIRRILGLKVREYMDVIAGRKELKGKRGGAGILAALNDIDVPSQIELARRGAMTLRGASRDDAVKRLRYLKAAQDQGLHPRDWVVTKAPVIPPIFRPVSQIGDMVRVTDLNELYRELIESSNNLGAMKAELPDDALAAEREQLYQSLAAAFGLGESVSAEGRSKRLTGAIRQVIGYRPKEGMFHRKVLSRTVDVVGRGVITPDPNLDMDSIGLPPDMAWELYKPFVTRRLSRRGFPPEAAAKLVAERSKEAADMLQQEMAERPVIMDRAPTWHKFNLLAFSPSISDGKVIRISPLIVNGFNADFDGDAVNIHVPVSDAAVKQSKERMLPSRNLFKLSDLESPMHTPGKEILLGLHQLTRPAVKGKPAVFNTVAEAKAAFRRGLIGANDPIVVRELQQ